MNDATYASETDERIGVTQHMRAAGEVMANAMLNSVQKIDVGLIFATMLKARDDVAATPEPVADDRMAGLKALAAFGVWCAHTLRESLADIDGGAAQSAMECSGVIVRSSVNEACGEGCVCATVTDFPTDCFTFTPSVKKVMTDLAGMLERIEGGAG